MRIFKEISEFYSIPIFYRGKLLKKLRGEWIAPKKKWRDYSKIKQLLELTTTHNQKGVVDNKTWYDLGMNAVFEDADITISEIGQQTLFKNLHLLEEDKNELKKKYAFAKRLGSDKELRESLQADLHPPPWVAAKPAVEFLYNTINLVKVSKSLILTWFVVSVAVFLSCAFLFRNYLFDSSSCSSCQFLSVPPHIEFLRAALSCINQPQSNYVCLTFY